MDSKKLGWILVHSEKRFGVDSEYLTPMDELEVYYKPGVLWHWTHVRPFRDGGPFTILFGWKGAVFGSCAADVTRKIRTKDFNFAFKLHAGFKEHKPVPFAQLALGNRLHHHRSVIKLDDKVLAAYKKWT